MIARRLLWPVVAAAAMLGTPAASAAQADESAAPQCRGTRGYAQDFDGRRTFLWRPQWLEALAGDTARSTALVEEARSALERGPYSVTDKQQLVPGAAPHDYTSIGPYWWPDPANRGGLPYIRRDGEVNPERNGVNFDKDRLRNLGRDMETLALGYYLTGDQRFAEHAAMLARTWFLDPDTRMAPNMNFAQGIPGRVAGRGEGIIEASDLSTVVESIGLIAPSQALSDSEMTELRAWFARFASWLATSENGSAEMQKTNNHGVFYDFYLAHFALFAGLDSVTKSIAENFARFRLARQMDRQGRFIAELDRTRSWHYSNYVVAGAARLATIGECVGADLWTEQLDDGRSMQTAAAFLDRYSQAVETWPFADRDHAAQRFDRMRHVHELVDVLFARGDHFPADGDLP
ncbi:MAG: alginate lyase family protein [Erythrobacter sp.]